MTTAEKPTEGQVLANAAVEVLWRGIESGRYALAFVDSVGVIERHRFADVAQEAAQWAEALRRHGIASGSRVLVLAGRDRHWRSALLGVVEVGAVAVPYAAAASSMALRALSVDGDAAAIVSAVQRPDVAEELGIPVLCPADLDWRHTQTAAVPAAPEAFALILPADDAAHGAPHTHASLLVQAEGGASLLGLQKGELCWSTLPDGSAESVWLALAAWRAGAELMVVQDDFTPEAHLDLLDRLRPAVVWFSDDEYAALASAQRSAGANLATIRLAYTSGEPAEGAVAFAGLVGITAGAAPTVGKAVIELAVPKDDGELREVEAAARAEEERRLAAALKRTEKERLQAEKKAQRREEQQAKELQREDKRRNKEEDTQRKLAEKAERGADRRRETERVRTEKEARDREEQRAKRRRKEATHRLKEETKRVKLAKKAEQEAERRHAEEEKRRARAAAENLKRAEEAARAEASRRTADEKRQEGERRRNDQEARRREEQQAKEREKDAERRAKEEAKQSKIAQKRNREAERRRVEEERRRLKTDERRRREEAKASEQAELEAERAPRRAERAERVESPNDRRGENERLSHDVISLLGDYGIANAGAKEEDGARGQRRQLSGPNERRETD